MIASLLSSRLPRFSVLRKTLPSIAMLALGVAFAANAADAAAAGDARPPAVDHHQHLLSAQGAALLNNPPQPVVLPDGVEQLLRQHEAAWNDPARLAKLYTHDSVTMRDFDPAWLHGRDAVAAMIGKRFARPYRITPLAYLGDERRGHLAGYYSRGEGEDLKRVGSMMIELVREQDGQWRIAVEYAVFPGPPVETTLDAERLVALLDAAGIRRAVVLSVAYWFDSPMFAVADRAGSMRAENLWTADQAAKFPDRLVAFCSLNPISDAALGALRDCVKDGRFKGLKLHFGSSKVDLLDPDHVRRVRGVFAAANKARLPIVVHVRGDETYGAAHARVLLDQLVAAAPDVVVQIAHLWGGENFAPEALAVYADAVSSRQPGTRNLYFDVTDAALVAGNPEQAQIVADRIRQIGLDRILYGSDAPFEGHPDPQNSWRAFRQGIPLTDAQFDTIAANVAPYLATPHPVRPR